MSQKNKKQKMLPAIPPEDYKGSQADWMVALQTRGLWDGEGWHGDVMIPKDTWWEILEECEGDDVKEDAAVRKMLDEVEPDVEELFPIAMEELAGTKFKSDEDRQMAIFKSGFASAVLYFGITPQEENKIS